MIKDIISFLISASVLLLVLTFIYKIFAFVFGTSWKGVTFIYDLVFSIKETVAEFRGNLSSDKKDNNKNINKDSDELAVSYVNKGSKKNYKINPKTIDLSKYKNNK